MFFFFKVMVNVIAKQARHQIDIKNFTFYETKQKVMI